MLDVIDRSHLKSTSDYWEDADCVRGKRRPTVVPLIQRSEMLNNAKKATNQLARMSSRLLSFVRQMVQICRFGLLLELDL